jgi:hypothetical protein
MKMPGLFSTVQIVAGMSMAGPMYVLGFTLLLDGDHAAGLGFFALGVVAMFLPSYVLGRIGGPRAWIKRRLGFGGGDTDDAEKFNPLEEQ